MLEDPAGNEVAKIQERKLSVRDKMSIERGDDSLATVRKALVGIRDRFSIDVAGGGDLQTKGNIVDHEYEIDRDGQAVAKVSKQWFRVRDTYGVEIAPSIPVARFHANRPSLKSCFRRDGAAGDPWPQHPVDGCSLHA